MAMAIATVTSASKIMCAPRTTILSSQNCPLSSLSINSTTFPKPLKHHPRLPLFLSSNHLSSCDSAISLTTPSPAPISSTNTFHGMCYVVYDNIDTDQIIPAEHCNPDPFEHDEYQRLGSFALSGLPASSYPIPFISPGQSQTLYSIIIGGANFGCGSSHLHAPLALGAAGVKAVVAESYARIFFRNSVATGEFYPLESEGPLCNEFTTGDEVTVEIQECKPINHITKLINHTTGKEYCLKPLWEAGFVIDEGGVFAFSRKPGMFHSK